MGTFLASDVLAQRRAFVEANLPDTCVVQRKNVTVTNGREVLDPVTPYIAEATYPCRFAAATEQEQVVAQQSAQPLSGAVILPAGTVIPSDRRLLISGVTAMTDGSVAWSQAFEVIAVPPFRSSETRRRVLVREAR